MKLLTLLSAIGCLLMGSNAFGANAHCVAVSDLSRTDAVEVEGERVGKAADRDKRDLRPAVRRACQEALNTCNKQVHLRASGSINFLQRQALRKHLTFVKSKTCYVDEASILNRNGRVIHAYRGMVDKTEFGVKDESKSFAPGELLLLPGESVETKTRQLIMQKDGNLVLYRVSGRDRNVKTPVWSSWGSKLNVGRPDAKGRFAVFQADGNLVVYNWKKEAVFDTQTDGIRASRLILEEEGDLVIYGRRGRLDFFNTAND